MSRRGFALLTVLWLLALLGMLAAACAALARRGAETTHNRAVLTRAGWALEACVEILLARYADDPTAHSVDTVDLGREAWCRLSLEDEAAKLDLNLADERALRVVLGSDSLVDALMDWRDADDQPRPLGAEAGWYRTEGRRLPRNAPLADVAELAYLRGFDSASVMRAESFLTSSGREQINLNTAPSTVLATLPGASDEMVGVVLRRRVLGRPLANAAELLSLLTPPARESIENRYDDFLARAIFETQRLSATAEGGVRGSRLVSRARLTLVVAPGRLAVTRRAVE